MPRRRDLALAGARRELAEEARADDLLVDRRLADVALPLVPALFSERQPPLTCFVASTVGSTVPFQSDTSGAGALASTQWYSTPSFTVVQVGSVPASESVPAGMLSPRRRSR